MSAVVFVRLPFPRKSLSDEAKAAVDSWVTESLKNPVDWYVDDHAIKRKI